MRTMSSAGFAKFLGDFGLFFIYPYKVSSRKTPMLKVLKSANFKAVVSTALRHYQSSKLFVFFFFKKIDDFG